MGLIDKIFGKRKEHGDLSSADKERGEFMPEAEIPVEDKFLINFKENGGKFLYCADEKEAKTNFFEILRENNWETAYCRDEKLKQFFFSAEIEFTQAKKASFALVTCEFLIADMGSLLISSNQIGEKKLSELPNNFVVYAGVKQLVNSVSDGLRNINMRKQGLPSNITTIKNFDASQKSSHFMNYGSTYKNLYLLLLEDF